MSSLPLKETPGAASAFEEYYALGEERSLELLAQHMYQRHAKDIPKVATILGQLKKWSTAHQWQQRIIERDRKAAEKEKRKRDKAIAAMNDRHALIATTQQAKAIKQIETLIEAKAFGSVATVQLLKLATDLERLARGAATERTEQTGLDGEPLHSQSLVQVYLPQKIEMKGGDADGVNKEQSEE